MAEKNKREPRRRPPATTPEARENQMMALATSLAEKQLREGTASSAVITHYLRLATTREELEKQQLIKKNKLIEAQIANMESAKRVEELYEAAISAMQKYSGANDEIEDY